MIISTCGKNHNTFYYHFQDKAALINWIFRYGLGKQLITCCENSELVYEEEGPFSSIPYYARTITGIRSVNNSFFMRCLFETLDALPNFYYQVLESDSRIEIEQKCLALLKKAFEGDLEIILAGRYLSKEDRELLIRHHASGILGFVEHVILDQKNPFSYYANAHFLNHALDSMSFEIENRRFSSQTNDK